MPDADAPLSRSQSDAENMSLRTYIDLQLMSVTADVKARREGMAAEELTYRAQVAAEEATFRAQVAQWRSMHEHVHAELKALAEANKETDMYLWTTAQDVNKTEHETLRAALVGAREAGDRALHDALAAHAEEHARARETDVLADKKMDIRLSEMNDLRLAVTNAQQSGVTRDQLDDRIAAVVARVDAVQQANTAAMQRLEAAIVDLQTSRANSAGRATALSTMIGIGTFIVTVAVAIALHFIK